MNNNPQIQSKEDFDATPSGWAKRWYVEITAAKKAAKKFQEAGKRITNIYLDHRSSQDDYLLRSTRLNVFSANIDTMRAMLFGNVPRVEVTRRFEDANDDVARVAAEMMERILNNDIGKMFSYAIGQSLDDRLLVGFGTARVRYEADFETNEVEPVTEVDEFGETHEIIPGYTEEKKTFEAAPVDYVNWRDVLWSPARTWDELRWFAFRAYLTQDQLVERFGEKIGKAVPLGKGSNRKQTTVTGIPDDPWQKAEVWEIWCKEEEKVYWYVEGFDTVLDAKDDPLGIDGFFPCPMPLLAHATSAAYMPRADYILAQDQYEEVNILSTRITMLQRAIKVVGVYDKGSDGVQRMLTEGVDNELIPVDNWAMFAEKGGIKGQVDWLPLDQVAAALQICVAQRQELIALLFQVTGMSDILRGASQQGETATAQSIKAKFASVRVQALQDEFARFATDLQKIRAQVMVNHFDDESLVKEANMEFTPDAQYVQPALQLMRDRYAMFRIAIKSEQLAAQDMALLRQEKGEFIQGLAMFLQAAQPMIDKYPMAAPTLLEMLKWSMSGFKGAATIEGVLDQAIAGLQQNPPPPPQDPNAGKEKAQQMKLQADMGREQFKAQAKGREIQMQTQADLVRLQAQTQAEVKKQAAEYMFDTQRQQRDDAASAVDRVTMMRRGGV